MNLAVTIPRMMQEWHTNCSNRIHKNSNDIPAGSCVHPTGMGQQKEREAISTHQRQRVGESKKPAIRNPGNCPQWL